MRFGRFLANRRVTMESLIDGVCAPTVARCVGRHVLAIEDSSEINLQAHAGRVSGLGTVGRGSTLGFFVHPLLVVDRADGACLGLGHVHVWQRTESKSPTYRDLPIEAKESFRWIKTIDAGKPRLAGAESVTVVADREADIYELFDRLPDAKTHVLIRAAQDRLLATTTGQRLFAWMDELPIQGSYHLPLAATKKRTAHEALLHIRFAPVTLKKPVHSPNPQASQSVNLYAIDVREEASTVPQGESPIHWRLLTTHPITTLVEAHDAIVWYRQRWQIEQSFRLIKRQGLNLEASQLEHGERLEKLAVLALSAAVRVLQLTMARDGLTNQDVSDGFTADEVEVLSHVIPTLEGKTAKQKNPHPPKTLAWAVWAIARLGGWKGYASERKPGPITLLHGLQTFTAIHQGWLIAKGLA